MPKNSKNKLPCSVALALSFLGDSWSLLILRDFMIFGGTRRFEQLREGLDISRNVLTERLKNFVELEIVRKNPVEEGAKRMEYRLSRKGWDLIPAVLAIHQWYERWRPDSENSPFEYADRLHGETLAKISAYSQDGRAVGPQDIIAKAMTDDAKDYLETFRCDAKKGNAVKTGAEDSLATGT